MVYTPAGVSTLLRKYLSPTCSKLSSACPADSPSETTGSTNADAPFSLLSIIKVGCITGDKRPTLYVPAGRVLPPTTNSNGTFTTTPLTSWAWALMPNPSRQVIVSTTVKYDVFIFLLCLRVLICSLE